MLKSMRAFLISDFNKCEAQMITFIIRIIAIVGLLGLGIYELTSKFYDLKLALSCKAKGILYVVCLFAVMYSFLPIILDIWEESCAPIASSTKEIDFSKEKNWIKKSKEFEIINRSNNVFYAIWIKIKLDSTVKVMVSPRIETYDLSVQIGDRIFSYDVFQEKGKDQEGNRFLYVFIHKLLPGERKAFNFEATKEQQQAGVSFPISVIKYSPNPSELVAFEDKLKQYVQGITLTAPETITLESMSILSKKANE